MKHRDTSGQKARRRTERGAINLVSLLLYVALIIGAYAAYQGVPLYVERMHISQLLKQAANQWVNVTPNLREVKQDLAHNFKVNKVQHVTVDDINFVQLSADEVSVSVRYSVLVRHPIEQLKPTRLKFSVSQTATRTLNLAE